MDIAEDNGTIFLVVGTWSTGTLFTYTVNVTSGQPIPSFQSVVRSGVTDIPWRDLYQNQTIGDLHISDVGFVILLFLLLFGGCKNESPNFLIIALPHW
jgi:hypothetical protein